MGCNHDHGPVSYNRAFAIGVALNVVFVIVEVIFGFVGQSLALLADAGHNLSDVVGLLLAWGAAALATRPSSGRRTYGWRSGTILAAVVNGLLLLVAVGGIVREAILRFQNPVDSEPAIMIVVASVGLVINAVTAWLFYSGRDKDLNLKGAYLHMVADAAVSLGVVITGAAMLFSEATWIDPVVSLVIAAVIFWGTWGLLRESTDLLLHAAPASIDMVKVHTYLEERSGVEEVKNLHVWAISTTETALTVHLVRPCHRIDDGFLSELDHDLRHEFEITHVTVQIEGKPDGGQCCEGANTTGSDDVAEASCEPGCEHREDVTPSQ